MKPTSAELRIWVEEASHHLPAQGPISVFVHHNTLHAFEDRRFEDAVIEAGAIFGCEPFLPEDDYREMVRTGQILTTDLADVVREQLGSRFGQELIAHHTTGELAEAILEYGVAEPAADSLDWHLDETSALDRLRVDIPAGLRARIREFSRFSEERQVARALWRASLAAARQVPLPALSADVSPNLHLRVPIEASRLADELLIPFNAAYLDQGVAKWSLPMRHQGYLACFLERFGGRSPAVGSWRRRLRTACRRWQRESSDAATMLCSLLEDVDPAGLQWRARIEASLLSLRGWAGMIHQLETRPDRFERGTPVGSLLEYLVVRVLVENEALRHHGLSMGPAPSTPNERAATLLRAYRIYQSAQLLGMSVDDLRLASDAELLAHVRCVESFDDRWRRWTLHLAMERRHRNRFLDGLCTHEGSTPREAPPSFQAIFCLDEREESLRRHLEELRDDCETYGIAGYFGIPMYYRALGSGQGVPLCPISITPRHEIVEVDEATGRTDFDPVLGSRLPLSLSPLRRDRFWHAPVTALAGAFALAVLILRVLFPQWQSGLRTLLPRRRGAPRTRLLVERTSDVQPSLGEFVGFTAEEMVDIVASCLQQMGLVRGFSDLVVIVGHGSASLNNPQESAHDCGACGGGRGGPNARAFAQMADLPAVRRGLREREIDIPDRCRFVGAYHNTCDDTIDYYDLHRLPAAHRPLLESARASLRAARGRDAQERTRRFLDVPPWFNPALALSHVADRSLDLAQPRPEYGHATNATCIVGRRARSVGTYLDRRCFLASYDPTTDDGRGSVLESVLAAVVPVCAGINLEYYFSYVDRTGYGCGTKLPHNITSLVGVMDGYRSDLRTGLPWQMVEIHEPVRLLIVIEAAPQRIDEVLERLPQVRQLFANGWVRLAALAPDGATVRNWVDGAWQLYEPQARTLPRVRNSREWYRGRRGHLGVAQIGGGQ